MKYLITLLLIAVSFTANASKWDGTTAGYIHSVNVTAGENYGFRVVLSGSPALCGDENISAGQDRAHNWAYLNESHSNYETFVSVLLAAYMADKKVTLYTLKETSSGNGYCRIAYIDVRDS